MLTVFYILVINVKLHLIGEDVRVLETLEIKWISMIYLIFSYILMNSHKKLKRREKSKGREIRDSSPSLIQNI
jgi:hypothetical protein